MPRTSPCINYVQSRWGYTVSVWMCIHGGSYPHSRWECAFLARHILIPGEDVHYRQVISPFPARHIPSLRIRILDDDESQMNKHPDREWRCDSLGISSLELWGCVSPEMGMCLTGKRDVHHWECTSSPGRMMSLTRIAHPHREWDMTHWECTSSPGMHIVYTEWTSTLVTAPIWILLAMKIHMN